MTCSVCPQCQEIFLIRESTDRGKVIVPQACPYCSHNGVFRSYGPVASWEDAVRLVANMERQ